MIRWNETLEVQAFARNYRMGQKRETFVYRIILRDSMEESMRLMSMKKAEMAEKLLSFASHI